MKPWGTALLCNLAIRALMHGVILYSDSYTCTYMHAYTDYHDPRWQMNEGMKIVYGFNAWR